MSHDRVLHGRVIFEGAFVPMYIAIDAGRISKVKRSWSSGEIEDFGHRLILPGGVDPHVHFRDPGARQKEDFTSGSHSALFGGVTTVLDMPNTDPPVRAGGALADKHETISGRSWVDYGLIANPATPADLAEMAHDICAVKLYTGSTTGGALPDPEGEVIAEAASRLGLTTMVHAEEQELLHPRKNPTLIAHDESRPPEAEIASVKRLAGWAARRLHITHLSVPESLDWIGSASCDVTPHHLLLHSGTDDTRALVNPPLRTAAWGPRLLAALAEGSIRFVASDHAPHTLEDKASLDPPSGIPGVETMVPLMLGLAEGGRFPWPRIPAVIAGAAARRFGLPKGRIAIGVDADFAIYERGATQPIQEDRLHSRADWSPFCGMSGLFPEMVILRGETVLESEQAVGSPAGRDLAGRRSG